MAEYPFLDKKIPLEARVVDLMSRLTLDEKIGLIPSHNQPIGRLGIAECYIGTEVARGFVGHADDEIGTVFPQPIGLAGTFDTELMTEIGGIAAAETRINKAKKPNISLMVWGPTVDMLRDPRWGRNEEAYGEDPCLTGNMSTAYTKALRGDKPDYMTTVPTLKHFCADNNEGTRGTCSVTMNDRLRHEYYYAAFRPAITAGGAYAVMASYNEINGMPMICNPDLYEVLKKQWGMGLTVSDGGDFTQTVNAHKFCKTHAEAFALAIKAGTDIMTDEVSAVRAAAYEALENGLIDEENINKAVFAVLSTRFRTGEFDAKFPLGDIPEGKLDCDAHKAVNSRAAHENVVLLKNNGILPLKRGSGGKIALLGYQADAILRDWYTGVASYGHTIRDGMEQVFGKENVLFDDTADRLNIRSVGTGKYLKVRKNGDIKADGEKTGKSTEFIRHRWSADETTLKSVLNDKYVFISDRAAATSDTNFRWFVDETIRPYSVCGHTLYKARLMQSLSVDDNGGIVAVKNARSTDNFLFDEEITSDGIERAAELARKCETAVVCIGSNPMFTARECYDRKDLELTAHDAALVKAVYAANPNTVVVVVSSYPYALNFEQANIPAVIYTSHAGPELGTAVADVLSGEYNPAGRLAQTWYKSAAELPDIEDYDIAANKMTYLYYDGEPLYPFGYGLSYSQFKYTAMKAAVKNGAVQITLDVKNTSKLDGDEVVQIYFKADSSVVSRPIKKLCAFARVNIGAGEKQRVSLTVPLDELKIYDYTAQGLLLEGGAYTFMAGASSADIRCEATAVIKGEKLPPRNLNSVTFAKDYDECSNAKIRYSRDNDEYFVSQTHWVTRLVFRNVKLDYYSCAELVASTTAGAGVVRIYLDDRSEPLVQAEIPVSCSAEQFATVECSFEETDDKLHTVVVELEKETNLRSIRLL